MPSDSTPYPIRRLAASDAELYRAIRLEGLELHPTAFGSSLVDEGSRPLAWFAKGLQANYVLGAEGADRLVGVAGFRRNDGAKIRHRATLWGMYVRAEARGTGVARHLVDRILAHARQHVDQVDLRVESENKPAIALYKSAGFVVTGRDRRSLKVDGAYYDELLMQVILR